MDEQTRRVLWGLVSVISETKPAEKISRKEIIERVKRRVPDGNTLSDCDIMRTFRKMLSGEV